MNREKKLEDLIDTILQIKSRKELRIFFLGLLTPKELEELPIRLAIVKMLKKGAGQHTIARKLGVGVATVTRGSKEIQKGRFENV